MTESTQSATRIQKWCKQSPILGPVFILPACIAVPFNYTLAMALFGLGLLFGVIPHSMGEWYYG